MNLKLILWCSSFGAVLLFSGAVVERNNRRQVTRTPFLLDLTYPFDNQTLQWVENIPFQVKTVYNGTKDLGEFTIWYQSEDLKLSTHSGTHLDAPCHMNLGKWCVSDIPITHLMDRPAAVLDVTRKCLKNRDYEVTVKDIIEWEARHGILPAHGVLVIQTGWGRFYPQKAKYFGTEGSNAAFVHFPGISPDAAKWLVRYRRLVGVAIEGPSLDLGQSPGLQTHVTLFGANIYGLENVPFWVNRLPARGATLTILPMNLRNGSGAPVRIVARMWA